MEFHWIATNISPRHSSDFGTTFVATLDDCSLRISFFIFLFAVSLLLIAVLISNCTCTSEFNLWLCVANVSPHWHKRHGWRCVFPRPQSADTVSAICRRLKGKENSVDWSSDNSGKKERALLEKNVHIFSRKNVLEVLRKIWELDKDCVILSKEAVCNFWM